WANTTVGDERHRHALSDPVLVQIVADSYDRARELVARHVRKLFDVRIVAAPAVPIAAAKAGRFDLNDGAVRIRRRIGEGRYRNRAAELVISYCIHRYWLIK